MFRTSYAVFAGLMLGTSAFAQSVELVTSTANDGEGSFRAALSALGETGGQIVIATDGDITIDSTLDYTGTAPLYVFGNGQTVTAADDFTVFAASQGAGLTITDLTFAGPGGYTIENRSDIDGQAGKGIFVDVRDDQQGLVALNLQNVTVRGVANHGIHVSDCNLADDCGGGGGGAGEGSAAGIILQLVNVTVDDAGNGKFDADGLRVDERGAGTINASIIGSTFTGVGADGIELDEGQDGDVRVIASGNTFTGNGDYCDPAILGQFMPDEDEGEYEAGTTQPADIPQQPTGTLDDGCFEYEVDLYDDGSVEAYEVAIDVDDAFDVDEAGPGSIVATVTDSTITNNFDEGLDFDEEDAGDIHITLIGMAASGNTDDGYKHSEEGDGDIHAIVIDTTANDNGGVGIVFEEEDGGDVTVSTLNASTSGNDDGDLGLEVVQEDDGTGALSITDSDFADSIETEGVDQQ